MLLLNSLDIIAKLINNVFVETITVNNFKMQFLNKDL